ncbi:MAG: rhodanese-like domain-containing protein [bacterium]|nr:rhodanese-like domain-containing protein [bacterium]
MDDGTFRCKTGVRIVLQAVLILVLGAGVGLAYNGLSASGIPVQTPEQVTLSEYVNWNLYIKDMHVSLEDAKKAFDEGNTVFVDARGPADYARGHIPGALSLMGPEVKTKGQELLSDLPKDARIITYCSGGSCQSSLHLADRLMDQLGFTRVGAFYGGWQEWTEAGHPVKTGDQP